MITLILGIKTSNEVQVPLVLDSLFFLGTTKIQAYGLICCREGAGHETRDKNLFFGPHSL